VALQGLTGIRTVDFFLVHDLGILFNIRSLLFNCQIIGGPASLVNAVVLATAC
jgi:hypothetical protein